MQTESDSTDSEGRLDPMWQASEILHVETDSLRPAENNARSHSRKQLDALAGVIREFGFTNPILIDSGGQVVAGHGRLEAAKRLGMTTVPCVVLEHLDEKMRRAYALADNRIAEMAEWDLGALKDELEILSEIGDINLEMLGWSEEEIDSILGNAAAPSGDATYSRKIEAPIYEPSETPPDISELIDTGKADSLKREIEAAELPDDIAGFLQVAADRHIRFDFHAIADFYASAGPKVQRLMERSALVIIDFDKAIENGFVNLSKQLCEIIGEERHHADA